MAWSEHPLVLSRVGLKREGGITMHDKCSSTTKQYVLECMCTDVRTERRFATRPSCLRRSVTAQARSHSEPKVLEYLIAVLIVTY